MPKKVVIQAPTEQKRKTAIKKKPVKEPEPELPDIVESGSETDQELEQVVVPVAKPKRKPAAKKVVLVEPEVEADAEPAENDVEEKAEPAARGRPRASKKVQREPSLWLSVLKENGFMLKGGSFKPTPKKGSAEYIAVRKIFDERKAALAAQ